MTATRFCPHCNKMRPEDLGQRHGYNNSKFTCHQCIANRSAGLSKKPTAKRALKQKQLDSLASYISSKE